MATGPDGTADTVYHPTLVVSDECGVGIEESLAVTSVNVYPNPVLDRLNVEFGKELTGVLMLVDITGRVIATFEVIKNKNVIIDIPELSSGIYGVVMPGVMLKNNRFNVIK
jgi:hypothetical protein